VTASSTTRLSSSWCWVLSASNVLTIGGGCLGGGLPIPTSPTIRQAHAKAIYAEDRSYRIRKSHENPAVVRLYERFLTDGPGGSQSHRLLHTHYTPRGKYIL